MLTDLHESLRKYVIARSSVRIREPLLFGDSQVFG
jgi:hypothetical protein